MAKRSVYETITIGSFAAIALFVLVSFLVQNNKEAVSSFVSAGGWFSVSAYIFFGILAVIVPPASNIFLIPVGAAAWGPVLTGFLNILGWTLGSVIVFMVSRKFGEKLRLRYPSLFEFPVVEKIISTKYQLLTLIFIRMSFPVDIVSYAVGFFTKVSFPTYLLATVIGITPFSFFFAYVNEIPFSITVSFVGAALVLFGIFIFLRLILIKRTDKSRGS